MNDGVSLVDRVGEGGRVNHMHTVTPVSVKGRILLLCISINFQYTEANFQFAPHYDRSPSLKGDVRCRELNIYYGGIIEI